MSNINQQQPINILKPLFFDNLLGFTGLYSDWSNPYFRTGLCFLSGYKSLLNCVISLCDVFPFW